MKRFTQIISFGLLLLLLLAAAPVYALTTTTYPGVNSISSISPSVIQRGSDSVTVTITGTNFTSITGSVWLEKSGENNINAQSISSWTNGNTIVCKFKVSSSKETGNWNVVVKTGWDPNATIVKENALAITEEMTLSAINPKTGQMGDNSVDFVLTGKNFDEDLIDEVYLYDKDYTNITADDIDVKSSTELKGSFDLDDAEEATYDVCILDKYGSVECDLSFDVTTNEVGDLDISSSPSGAAVSVDGVSKGNTPVTVSDLTVGSHKVVLTKAGYQEWGKTVKIVADETYEVDATLYAVPTAVQTAAPTPVQTAAPQTTRTTVKSTMKIPTTWVDTPTTTAASPVDPLLIIGAIGLGFIALRKP